MHFDRYYEKNFAGYLEPGKVLVLFGPRQAGKTTLIRTFLNTVAGEKYRFDTGDDVRVQRIFESRDLAALLAYVEGYQLFVLDEAQRIPHVGLGLKMLVDHRPDLRIIATGSSSFELSGQVGEPLTGRKRTLTLHPLGQFELRRQHAPQELRDQLASFLVYGSYPSVRAASSNRARAELLDEIAHAYLLKDILELERVKGAKVLLDLLRLLAFQIGSEVSLSELGRQLHIDTKTVARYLDLFERSFVLINLRGFSRNLRKEMTKKSKYYFYDTGIRNAIIANYNGIELRNDVGQLWENFVVIERMKKRTYAGISANTYFWRTWDQQEIDLVEEREGKLFGYECKWKAGKVAPPKDWLAEYPDAAFEVVTPDHFLPFVA